VEGEHIRYFSPDGGVVNPLDCQACSISSSTAVLSRDYGEKCFPCQSGSSRLVGKDRCVCLEKNLGGLCLTNVDYDKMKNKFPVFDSPNRDRVDFEFLVDTSVPTKSTNVESSLFECDLQNVNSTFL
jgi:hypothetical protein